MGKRKPLPKKFQGVPVVRGKPTNADAVDKLVEECAHMDFPRGRFFLVVDERFDDSDVRDGKVFSNLADAKMYARACGNGNVDKRVLSCTSALLVVATENDL